MSDIEMHYRFERHWEENASKETWANKTVAWNIWQEKQAEIAQLKAQKERLQKQFNFLLDKNIRDESAHASLKLRVMSASRLMDKAAENGTECVDIGSLYDALIKGGDLDQALRGEHETN